MYTALNPTARFSDRVQDYTLYRPGYPPELLDALRERVGLTAASVVADIGSGTGILTRMMLELGCEVYAVEPNREMRLQAERTLSGEHFHSVDAAAEATTLPDGGVDLITAAQAFHWFDPVRARAEFTRILRPGGYVALIWNDRQTTGSPFLEAYEELLQNYAPDYANVNHRALITGEDEKLQAFFAPDFMARYRVASHVQPLDFEGFVGRALSSSYVPQRGRPGHEEFMRALVAVYDRFSTGGYVYFLYHTDLYYGTLHSVEVPE